MTLTLDLHAQMLQMTDALIMEKKRIPEKTTPHYTEIIIVHVSYALDKLNLHQFLQFDLEV